uniref:C-type lectin domain-containing protein n=1 Tax=Oryzias sinensis TaxID=183150 RepID=A0A8C8DSL9_9TELE
VQFLIFNSFVCLFVLFLCLPDSDTSERFYFIEKVKTWFEAQRFCRDKHTDLVSGLQQLRDEKLKTMLDLKTQYFSSYDFVYIGLFNDAWEWSNGSSFSFRQWDRNDYGGGNKYAMLTQSGMSKTSSNGEKPFFCYEGESLSQCDQHIHPVISKCFTDNINIH